MKTIRNALKKDYEDILKLNQADVEMLSPLNEELLSKMDELSEVFSVVEIDGDVAAFIMAFKDNCDYWSDNYQWFLNEYTNFIYIDRIVIDKNYRKQGLGRELYESIFDYASTGGFSMVCAEIDIEPEYNYSSMKFHKKMGFHEVGTKISKETLTVSLQVKEI